MLFNSLEFFIFFVLVICLYSVVQQRYKTGLLMLTSWYFYGFWDLKFVFLIVFSTGVNYFFGGCIQNGSSKKIKYAWLVISVITNLSLLGFFKYFNFFIDSLSCVLSAMGCEDPLPYVKILLPIGISFYTFQAMSYTIDVYREKIQACKNFFDFGAFVSFFPLLLAGPIERASTLLLQLKGHHLPKSQVLISGFFLFSWGLFKKIVIADNLSPISDLVFGSDPRAPLDTGLALLGAYAYTFQIYCDFSGYTDMARGTAKFFGIELTLNFNSPYLAESIRDFWRRWHISLSSWFRDYLYIPLGGNRGGAFDTHRNVLITMTLCGLWHGASWMYVLWGVYHGILMILERTAIYSRWIEERQSKWVKRLWTFQLIALGWVIFRSPDMAVLNHWGGMLVSMNAHPDYYHLWGYLLFFLCPLYVMRRFRTLFTGSALHDGMGFLGGKQAFSAVMLTLFYWGVMVYGADQARAFIYFQF